MERNRRRNPAVETDEIDGKARPLNAYILHGFKDISDLPQSQLLTPGPLLGAYPGAGLSCRPFADPNGIDVVRALYPNLTG
jgi:hypothetical protein